MAVSFIPLVGPIISCIIDGTFVDMFNALMKGDWATVGMCAMGFVPGMKSLKGLKAFGILGKAEKAGAKGERLFAKSSFRKNLIEMTGKNPGKSMEAHHVLPKKFEGMFKASKIDNIHNPKYGAWVETSSHRQWSNQYNKEWEGFFRNGASSPDNVEAFARDLGDRYGFDTFF